MRAPSGTWTSLLRLRLALAYGLVTATACEPAPLTGPSVTSVRLARAAGGGGPEVNATDPTSAPQDTTLDVHVFGSGFEHGSAVSFTLAGAPTEKVHTNATRFVSQREVIANITIALDAVTDRYDVEVLNLGGKNGVGADLFEVFAKGGQPASDIPLDATMDDAFWGIRSDGNGAYSDGAQEVQTVVTGDRGQLLLSTLNAEARSFRVRVVDSTGAVLYDGLADGSMQTKDVVDVRTVTGTVDIPFRVVWSSGTKQYKLRFGRDCADNVLVAADQVQLTRTSEVSWRLATVDGRRARLCVVDHPTNSPKTWTSAEILGVSAPFSMNFAVQP